MVVDFVISFGQGEGFGNKGTGVALSISVELCKDGSRGVLGGVAFDLKGFCLIRHNEDWFFSKSLF